MILLQSDYSVSEITKTFGAKRGFKFFLITIKSDLKNLIYYDVL